jgi:hypothetical protein
MKNFVRLELFALAIGLAGLLAGCTSYHQSTTQRTRLAHDFEVVETSTKRTLNAKEMAVLRTKVEDYLDKQGATSSGNYYVKVFLGADDDGVPGEWVIVRFSRDMDMRFQLLGSDDSYYSSARSYAAYDVYPYGYDNFSRVSIQYYDEPYYGGGYYFPPQRWDNHNRNRDHDGDHHGRKDRDHDGDHDGDHHRGKDGDHDSDHRRGDDHPRSQSSDGASQITHHRWAGDSSGQSNPPHENNFPRRGGDSSHPHPDRLNSNERTYTSPVRTSSQSAPRTDTTSYPSAPSQPSFRTSSQSTPSYSPPPARSESHSGSNSNQSSQEPKLPAAKRSLTE